MNAGRRWGILDMTGRGRWDKGGQERGCSSFGRKAHPPALGIFVGLPPQRGGWPLTAPARSRSTRKAWLVESCTHIHTKHLRNLKLPHHLISGRSAAPLASPLNGPRMVSRITVTSREEGISTGPSRDPLLCVSLWRNDGPRRCYHCMRIYTVPMYTAPLTRDLKCPGSKVPCPSPHHSPQIPLAASREKACPCGGCPWEEECTCAQLSLAGIQRLD